MTDIGRFELRVSEDDERVAYLRLPTHPGTPASVSKSVRLVDLLGTFKGPEVVLDFDENDVPVGTMRSWDESQRI